MDEPLEQLKSLMNELFIKDIKEIAENTNREVKKSFQTTIDNFNNELEERIQKSVRLEVEPGFRNLQSHWDSTKDNLNRIYNKNAEYHDNQLELLQEIKLQFTELEKQLNQSNENVTDSLNKLYNEMIEEKVQFHVEFSDLKHLNKNTGESVRKSYEDFKQNSAVSVKQIDAKLREFIENIRGRIKSGEDRIASDIAVNSESLKKMEGKIQFSENSLSTLNASIPDLSMKVVTQVREQIGNKIDLIETVSNSQQKLTTYVVILFFLTIINLGLIIKLLLK